MQYKTISLELIREQEPLHERLKSGRTLLATMERLAEDLKSSHLRLTDQLSRSHPELSEAHRTSAALELAVEALRAGLRTESFSNAAEA